MEKATWLEVARDKNTLAKQHGTHDELWATCAIIASSRAAPGTARPAGQLPRINGPACRDARPSNGHRLNTGGDASVR